MQDVLEEIVEWSEGLPGWQRDALRRIFAERQIADGDIDDLLDLCKAAHGLTQPRKVEPLTHTHVAVKESSTGNISLMSVTHHQGVNALAPEQTLIFGPQITVVFGQNAAGKSGYTRILKSSGRSRATEKILGNVLGSDTPFKAQATIRFREDELEDEFAWTPETWSAVLPAVSVFDAHCVPVYLREQTDVAFRPFSLDVFDKLSTVCGTLRKRLEAELAQLNAVPFSPPRCPEGTQARHLVENLTSLTPIDTLNELATLSNAERTRLAELRDLERDAQASDPKLRARELGGKADRIGELIQHLTSVDEILGRGGVVKLQDAADSLRAARESLRILREATLTSDLLPGTGEEAWRSMWESAARFSSRAYPGREFPVVTADASCPLCQQPLDGDAVDRLHHFREYVTSTADAELRKADIAHRAAFDRIARLSPTRSDVELTITEIGNDNPDLAQSVRTFLEAAQNAQKWLQTGESGELASRSTALGTSPTSDLRYLAASYRERATQLQNQSAAKDPKSASELRDLEGRVLLSDHLKVISAEIERKKRQAAYRQCLDDTGTQAITRKSTELTKRLITDQLRTTFQQELQKVGFTHLSVEVQPAGGAKGALFHRLVFSNAPKVTVTDVLSEGESRTLSLAAFMTELSTASSRSAIIFDDPVSSLDHLWRNRIAARLVAEAKVRQVIVFTHDILFLRTLIDLSEKEKVACAHQYVRREGSSGFSSSDLPWIAMNVKDRIGALRKRWQAAEKLSRTVTGEDYEKDARDIYGLMREAWEQATTEVLLNDVVERYRVSIETQKVRVLSDITEDDCTIVEDNMSECSRWMRGHDHPAADGTPFPRPAELKGSIDNLEDWVKSVRKRRENRK